MNIDAPIIIKNIKTDGNDDVQVWWLEHKEILILILKHKLVDERILLKSFQLFLKLLHIKVTTPVCENFEAAVS